MMSKDALDDFRRRQPNHSTTPAHVSKEADLAGTFGKMAASFGGLDAFISNAGIAGPTKPVEKISRDEWRRCIDVGLSGQFPGCG